MDRKNAWTTYSKEELDRLEQVNTEYKNCLDAGKTERECVALAVEKAKAEGYKDIRDIIKNGGEVKAGDKLYAVCMNKTIALFHMGTKPLTEGMNILGAHIDSPRIDVKQNPLYENEEFAYLDTHYYGGIKKYQWVTLPLALHGVIAKKDGTTVQVSIGEKEDDPVFVITDLLIHLASKQMEKKAATVVEGEKLDLLIGSRPIDQHIKGFKMLGAQIEIENGMISATAEELKGAHIYMDVVSVGATINVMMAASLAKGNTIIENAAKEPHVVDVANFLNSMGAKIRGAGTDVIRIKGVEKFGDCQYSIIPDQIEAGTFMTAAVATKGDIMIKNVIPKHLEAISAKLIEIGAEVVEFDDAVRVSATKRLESTNIKTLPYPGFPTDMQPQMAVTLALSNGTSVISESIFENRFRYVDELTKMGATIQVDGRTAIISGVEGFTGADVHAPDLRAGAALVIAGLSAKGFTTVSDIGYIYRGYEQFEQKLKQLGGEIQLVNNEKEVAKFKLKIG